MKKRILSLALALVMCLGLAIPALAAEIVDSGKCGDNLTWTLDSEGTLTISGTGDMWDYNDNEDSLDSPWIGNQNIQNVIFEDGITSIGKAAFAHCNLISVWITSSVTRIGTSGFNLNGRLTDITVDNENPVYSSKDGVLFNIPAGADYTQAVAWAVEQAVTTGTGDTTFSPESICSRGQIVTFLQRAMAEK
ncbi:MAG: leucine-rich repeat protein [Oscillospiraceae bacterium]|nr:leucine-rich repeat protein [Oscillospiraceae bacterium]